MLTVSKNRSIRKENRPVANRKNTSCCSRQLSVVVAKRKKRVLWNALRVVFKQFRGG